MLYATADAAQLALEALRDPERAAHSSRYFKATPARAPSGDGRRGRTQASGDYGAGDQFLGVRVPDVRSVARHCTLPLPELERLVVSPWHEARLLAVLLYAKAFAARPARGEDPTARRRALYESYLRHTAYINNWDLVDSSAEYVVGAWLADKDRAPLRTLAASESVWERRIAMLATFCFIKRGETHDAVAIATELLHDRHDLIHKAVGWMLRELGQRGGADVLTTFLDAHAPEMPRTALRTAIEHLPPDRRAHYLGLPRTG